MMCKHNSVAVSNKGQYHFDHKSQDQMLAICCKKRTASRKQVNEELAVGEVGECDWKAIDGDGSLPVPVGKKADAFSVPPEIDEL